MENDYTYFGPNDFHGNVLRIGDMAPDFTAETTFGPIKMSDYKGKWLVFFSHPGDFTPVCTTEFLAFTKYYQEFLKLNTNLLGLSIDSNPSHLDWVFSIYKSTGVQIPFPVVADRDMKVSMLYGMIAPNASSTQTIRSVFIIDPDQKIRAILQYPLTNGRNIGEILRLVEALQTTDKENVVTPANWLPGQPVLVRYPNTYEGLMERVTNPAGLNCIDWYLCFKSDNMSPYNMPVPDSMQYNQPINFMG